ncbi:MAG: hypothetical protein JSV56_07060 [Methanomassiliicoccales archaeon]|nr:MAG: hypothetical protein JSV56_07060 [Methanomassiliicoccales archaeon]
MRNKIEYKVQNVEEDSIYQEKLFAKGIAASLGIVAILMLFFLVYLVIERSFDEGTGLFWFFLIMFLIFFFLTWNFGWLSIKMTFHFISVGYGIIKHTEHWENVADCRQDDVSAIKYGGFGIRVAKIKGKTRLVYNTIGTPRCVLSLKGGKFQEFVFSTKNPEEVINVIRGQLALKHL